MNEPNNRLTPAALEPLRRYVPLAVWVIVVLTLLLIPLKIIGYGYLPGDDALAARGQGRERQTVVGNPRAERRLQN